MVRCAASSLMTRIAVFGGSFDPPHLGHKALVQAALHELELDEVWVMPVGQAVHRKLTAHISAKQRLAWVEQMFADMQGVRVLDWEVKQSNPTPSIAVMRWLQKQVDGVPVWLMGMDAWQGLPSWLDYPEHQQWCNIAVFPREGEVAEKHAGWMQVKHVSMLQAGQVYWAHSLLPNISATQIRQDILTGKDVSTVLDAGIAKEIQTAYIERSNGVNE